MAYKQYSRQSRNAVIEENFGLGMRYTDTPLEEGYSRVLVNFELKDEGDTLVPRRGMHTLHRRAVNQAKHIKTIHHTGTAYLFDETLQSDTTIRYVMTCPKGVASFDFQDAEFLIEQSFNADFASDAGKDFLYVAPDAAREDVTVLLSKRHRTTLLHDINLADPETLKGSEHLPTFASLNGRTLLPIQGGFGLLSFTRGEDATITCDLEPIDPKEVSPTEAFNYGYNMLAETPYSFSDTVSELIPSNYIILEGVVPYTDLSCTTPKFNSKVGERVTFRVFASFPNNTDTYKFRWEIREIGTEQVTILEDQASPYAAEYKYGDSIVKAFLPPYRQFSLTVIAYSTVDLTEPLQAMTLASYTMTADHSRSSTNAEVLTYPLASAGGATAWKQRVVLWDVTGADNMIFVSDINDPSYFPYPHNVELFDGKVVACVPHLDNLLVFTTSKLYSLTWTPDGLSWTAETVQDRLLMTPFDIDTIVPVQNMVFFKNGPYYYMIVPRANAGVSELVLAPISNPITNFLDNFKESVEEIVSRIYIPESNPKLPSIRSNHARQLQLYDYYTYLDNAEIRCVYKYRLIDRAIDSASYDVLLYFDFTLHYNTFTRTWVSSITQTTDERFVAYQQNVTDTTVFVYNAWEHIDMEDGEGFSNHVTFIKANPLAAVDDFTLVTDGTIRSRIFENFQYLDTGYRDHDAQVKKRYREIQFKVNNITQSALQFATEFLIDDDIRKELYQYTTQFVEDPTSPDYGYFYIEKQFNDDLIVPGATVLEGLLPEERLPLSQPNAYTTLSDSIMLESKRWTLDVSKLAKTAVAKVRMRVSGKGYSPRLVLVSFNTERYELMNLNWVQRLMNMR